MANPIAYNSGTTVSGCINTGTISLAVDNLNYSTRPGNLNWYAGGDNTNKYIIISDTYSQGVDTQANSRPTMWATSALTDNELLKWINGLPARSGQSTFGTLAGAISWLTGQNKYLISNQHYPQIVTSGMVLNLDAGFTASYPNVGTSWYDLYSGGTGSLNNGPTWNNLGMSSNISFDGTNDYYELTNGNTSLEFQPNQPYSCLVFYRSPVSAAYGSLIADMQDAGTPAYPGWDIWFNNGDIGNTISMHLISDWPANAIKVAVNYNFSQLSNRWLCFGYTYDGSTPTNSGNTLNSVDFYLNGQIYSNGKQLGSINKTHGDGFNTPVTTITYNPNQRFRVASRWSTSGWVTGSQTSVAKVLVYNRKLTENEFAQNFYSGPIVTSGLTFAIDAGNLVSYGGVGTTVYDLTTTGVTGTLTNGPTWTYLSGGTFSFDGVDDYIGFGDILDLTNNITISVWCNSNNLSGPQNIFAKPFQYWLHKESGTDKFRFKIETPTRYEVEANLSLNTNQWYYLVGSYNGTVMKIYVNGVEYGSLNVTGNISNTSNSLNVGGWTSGADGFKGNISTAQVYNRALSESEIKQNFEAYRGRFGV